MEVAPTKVSSETIPKHSFSIAVPEEKRSKMLTLNEHRRILTLWRHFSRFSMFPIAVDPDSWELRAENDSKRKPWASRISFLLFIAHALYIILSLVPALHFHRDIPLHKMIMHGNMAAASATFSFWYYVLYFKYSDLNAEFVRMTLRGYLAESARENGQRHLWERSLQDLLGILMPVLIPLSTLIVLACILYDPTMKFVLYAALPRKFQNWLSFIICSMEETRFLYMFAAITIPMWQVQLVAFAMINSRLEKIVDAVSAV